MIVKKKKKKRKKKRKKTSRNSNQALPIQTITIIIIKLNRSIVQILNNKIFVNNKYRDVFESCGRRGEGEKRKKKGGKVGGGEEKEKKEPEVLIENICELHSNPQFPIQDPCGYPLRRRKEKKKKFKLKRNF